MPTCMTLKKAIHTMTMMPTTSYYVASDLNTLVIPVDLLDLDLQREIFAAGLTTASCCSQCLLASSSLKNTTRVCTVQCRHAPNAQTHNVIAHCSCHYFCKITRTQDGTLRQGRGGHFRGERGRHDSDSIAVDGHFRAKTPWFNYHKNLSQLSAVIIGAEQNEVVTMNGLTVNLHLLLTSFYQPSKNKYKILCEPHLFPSDLYVLRSQIELRGYNPDESIVFLPADSNGIVIEEEIYNTIESHKDELTLVFLGAVNYYTGQVFDLKKITQFAHQHNIIAGFDLMVAPSNIEPFGRTLVEAMLQKTPVIAAKGGGHSEIIQHGLNGLLYNHNDVDDFIIQINKYIGNLNITSSIKVVYIFVWHFLILNKAHHL